MVKILWLLQYVKTGLGLLFVSFNFIATIFEKDYFVDLFLRLQIVLVTIRGKSTIN